MKKEIRRYWGLTLNSSKKLLGERLNGRMLCGSLRYFALPQRQVKSDSLIAGFLSAFEFAR